MKSKLPPLPKGLLYWRNRLMGFKGSFDMSDKKLKTATIDSSDQIRRAKEMNSREAFDFLRSGGTLHPEAVHIAAGKLSSEQAEFLLASKPAQEISIPLQVRLQELQHKEKA